MLKRTLYFTKPSYLKLKNKQLVVELKESGEQKSVPIEDIGYMLIENQQISLSMPLLEALSLQNVAVIFCNSKHHPQSMLMSLDGNHQQTEIYRQQVAASEPLKKNLWKQTVMAKIENQAAVLEALGKDAHPLPHLARQVKSGDTDNREGMAARLYWSKLFGKGFVRERHGVWPNAFLNYGYSIIRAATARALAGSGLLPSFGIFHSNRYNAFCLADDMMEPYRPFVDKAVWELCKKNPEAETVDTQLKTGILTLLSCDVRMKGST